MKRRAWVVFGTVQTIGAIAALSCATESWNRYQWYAAHVAFVGLFPGNILGPTIVERALWNTGVTLKEMSTLAFGLAVAVNAALWALFMFVGRFVVRFVRSLLTQSQG